MGWLNDILRRGRIAPARRGQWTVNGYREGEVRALIHRTFHSYSKAWESFEKLRVQQHADILEIYRPDGTLFWQWSRFEREGGV